MIRGLSTALQDASASPGALPKESQLDAHIATLRQITPFGEEEELCGVCLERPEEGAFVELWCCGNVLCVSDAQMLGTCPFCRQEPIMWNITK